MKKITFSFNWWRTDGQCVDNSHDEHLENAAMERAIEMWKDGYTSGELNETVGNDEIGYRGWWKVESTYEDK